jgi:hypothetical protein
MQLDMGRTADVRRGAGILGGGCQLDLDAVDAVDAVDEEDQDEDEGDLEPILDFGYERILGDEAGAPRGQPERDGCGSAEKTVRAYVNTLLRMAKGNGRIRSMKRAISATRSRKTWDRCQSLGAAWEAATASQLDEKHTGEHIPECSTASSWLFG